MDKPIITEEQQRAIENLLRNNSKRVILQNHKDFEWTKEQNKSLNRISLYGMEKILENGYELEIHPKLGEWVYLTTLDITSRVEAIEDGVYILENGSKAKSINLRYATREQIEQARHIKVKSEREKKYTISKTHLIEFYENELQKVESKLKSVHAMKATTSNKTFKELLQRDKEKLDAIQGVVEGFIHNAKKLK